MVHITPIISRSTIGEVFLEAGAGGDATGLVQSHEVALPGLEDLLSLTKTCTEKIETSSKIQDLGSDMITSQKKTLPSDALNLDLTKESIPLAEIAQALARGAARGGDLAQASSVLNEAMKRTDFTLRGSELPRIIVCLSELTDVRTKTKFLCSNSLIRVIRRMMNSVILWQHSDPPMSIPALSTMRIGMSK